MPTARKKTSQGRRRTPRKVTKQPSAAARVSAAASTVSAMASAQFKQLRKTAEQLKARLEKEAKARGVDKAVLQEAKKAHKRLAQQMGTLKEQGVRLSKQLRKALSDADQREMARQQALAKISELRGELAHKTNELKRKSEELAKLARESVSRAKDIIMGEAGEAAQVLPDASKAEQAEHQKDTQI